MIISDFKCEDCDHIFTVEKESSLDSFPERGELECPECGSNNTFRVWGCGAIEVSEGMMGNAKNGYSKGITYHRSSIVGKVKGTRVK